MINPARDVTAFVLSIDKRPESKTLQDCATATGISMTEQENNRNEEDYVGEIKGGLRPTMRLIVMGIVHKQPRSMEVLVSCQSKGEGDDEIEGDVGLELKVKFPEKTVLRNARLSGKWGTSESALSFFPFAPGEAFKMEIVCEHQQFRVLVDGQPLCGFAHRLTHLGSLNALRVHGDLQLTKVA